MTWRYEHQGDEHDDRGDGARLDLAQRSGTDMSYLAATAHKAVATAAMVSTQVSSGTAVESMTSS